MFSSSNLFNFSRPIYLRSIVLFWYWNLFNFFPVFFSSNLFHFFPSNLSSYDVISSCSPRSDSSTLIPRGCHAAWSSGHVICSVSKKYTKVHSDSVKSRDLWPIRVVETPPYFGVSTGKCLISGVFSGEIDNFTRGETLETLWPQNRSTHTHMLYITLIYIEVYLFN